MSAELFHVIAAIIRRHTRDQPTIPLVTRFDPHDKLTSSPHPFLFQRVVGPRREVFSSTTVVHILGQLLRRAGRTSSGVRRGQVHPARLPAAAGHRPGQQRPADPHRSRTTRTSRPWNHPGLRRGLREDLVRHYQAYLDRRRTLRPDHEYRPATPRSGARSRSTSTSARSNSATAGGPTELVVRTSTRASGVPFFRSTRRCCPASTSLRRI